MVEAHTEDSSTEPIDAEAGGPAAIRRYSFSAFARDSWTQFRSATRPLVTIFCAVHIVSAVLPYLVVFDVPDAVGYPLVFLFRVVIPVVLGTIAVAIASVVLDGRRDGEGSEGAVANGALQSLRTRWADVLVLGLVASLMGTGAVFLLGAYGFLILHFFYGPPIAAQVLTVEGSTYRDALQRARTLLRGNWRVVLYLLNSALVIGALGLLLLDLVLRLVGDGSDAVVRPLMGLAQGLVLGTLTAFVAAAQFAVFLYLRDQVPPSGSEPDAATPVSPTSAPTPG